MAYDLIVTKQFSLAGKSYVHQETISKDELGNPFESLIPIAWAGVLTVRTDANTGSLTMDDADHIIATGNKLDLYWTNADGTLGARRNMTAGTVAGLVVPIDLGSGDDLPIATTVVQAAVVQVFTVEIIGNDVATIVAAADFTRAQIVLLGTGGTVEHLHIPLILNGAYDWLGSGTNPIAGDVVDTLNITIADTTTERNVRLATQLT